MRRLALFAAALAMLTGCATTSPTIPPWTGYYVMRHLHTPAGKRDPDLTAEGRRQAALLPNWVSEAPPRAVYVSQFKRTQQTAAAVAERFGLTPIVYDPSNTPALIAQVRGGPLPALVVGHSNTVPDIVEALGGSRPAPLVHEDFGDVWVVSPDGQSQRLKLSESRPRAGGGSR
jgi:phosphohistidine phosphatase SixA